MAHRRGSLPALLLLSLAALAGCSRDPEVLKKEYVEKGDAYVATEKYAEAAIAYRNALQQDERFGEARFKLSQAYVHLGEGTKAAREAVRAADLLDKRVDVQLHATTLLLLGGAFADARDRGERVLALDANNIPAHLMIARSMAGLHDLDGAIDEVKKALTIDVNHVESYVSLGNLYLAKGDSKTAEATFIEATRRDPASVDAKLTLGQFYWRAGRTADAEATMLQAHAMKPGDSIANRLLAVFYQSTHRQEEAERYLRAAVETENTPIARLSLANYYMFVNRPGAAIPILDSLASDPKVGIDARLQRARIHSDAGEFAAAIAIVDAILQKEPKHEQAHLAKTEILTAARRLDDALASADSAVKASPRSADAQFARGRVLMARNDFDKAKQAFDEVLKMNPNADGAQIELARLHLANGAIDSAAALAGGAVKANPRSVEARVVLARSLMQRGELIQAEALLKELSVLAPQAAGVHTHIGLLALMKRRPADATAAFEQALAIDPMQLEAIDGLVKLEVAAGRVDAAKQRLDSLLNQHPLTGAKAVVAARGFALLKDMKRVEEVLIASIGDDPNATAPYTLLGQVYLGQQRLDDAVKQFQHIAGRGFEPVGALTMVGIIQQMQNRHADARKTFERVIELDSHAAVAANNLAWIYVKAGEQLDMALQLAQTAKERLPNDADVSDTLGWVYFRKGLLPQAIRSLQQSVEQQPSRASFQYHLGMAYAQNGDHDQARKALTAALKLDPKFEDAADATSTLSRLDSSPAGE